LYKNNLLSLEVFDVAMSLFSFLFLEESGKLIAHAHIKEIKRHIHFYNKENNKTSSISIFLFFFLIEIVMMTSYFLF